MRASKAGRQEAELRLENDVEISEEISMVMVKDGNLSSARVGSGAGQMKEQLSMLS